MMNYGFGGRTGLKVYIGKDKGLINYIFRRLKDRVKIPEYLTDSFDYLVLYSGTNEVDYLSNNSLFEDYRDVDIATFLKECELSYTPLEGIHVIAWDEDGEEAQSGDLIQIISGPKPFLVKVYGELIEFKRIERV